MKVLLAILHKGQRLAETDQAVNAVDIESLSEVDQVPALSRKYTNKYMYSEARSDLVNIWQLVVEEV